MKFLEKLVFSLWIGFLAANVAILASALPYIYTKEDDAMRCGSLGLTSFAINMVPMPILMITVMAVLCYIGRACISANRRRRVPAAGWVVAWDVAFWGLLLWLPGFLTGAGVFAVFLITFTKMLQHPPELPTNRNDVTACSDFILNTNPLDYYNPFQDLEDWLKRHTG
jgi:hypothetical protein